MKTERDFRFDVIRVMALGFIMICHFASWLPGRTAAGIHDVCAPTGNVIFFLISGWLLGMKWRRLNLAGGGGYGFSFLVHCAKRIYFPLWGFLVPYLIFHCCRSGSVDLTGIVLNLLGLCWFHKMPGIGHLWYITMILMFYVLLVPLSRSPREWLSHRRLVFFGTLAIALVVQYVMFLFGIGQRYLISFLWSGSMLFLYGDRVLDWMEAHGRGWLYRIVMMVLAISSNLLLWLMGNSDAKASQYWIALVSGMSLVALVMPLIRKDRSCGVVTWCSLISFDVYLVHCVFQGSQVGQFFGNDVLWFAVYLIGSFVFAAMLRRARRWVAGLVAASHFGAAF